LYTWMVSLSSRRSRSASCFRYLETESTPKQVLFVAISSRTWIITQTMDLAEIEKFKSSSNHNVDVP
jgi:hypothetical protein